jgi:RNA polymerase sigma-70 factor, ECF subfamily
MSESRIEAIPKGPPSRTFRTIGRRSERSGSRGAVDERALVARTLAGDASAFLELVNLHHASFLRLACALGQEESVAQEIATTAWLAILDGLASFQFDRPLRTWMMRIVAGLAASQGGAALPFAASVRGDEAAGDEPEPARFDAAGAWANPPAPWDGELLVERHVTTAVKTAISGLPAAERAVVTLRDVEGLPAEDACAILDLGMGEQRALLHRGRAHLWRAVDHAARRSSGLCQASSCPASSVGLAAPAK